MEKKKIELVTLPVEDFKILHKDQFALIGLESKGLIPTEEEIEYEEEDTIDLIERYNSYYGPKNVRTELSGYQIEKSGWEPYYVESYGENRVENYKNGKYILKFGTAYNNVLIGEHPWQLPIYADKYEKDMHRTQVKFDGVIKYLEDLETVLKLCTTIYELEGELTEEAKHRINTEGTGGNSFGNIQ